MALTKCKECGNEVSTQAKFCPKCGAAVRYEIGRGITRIVLGVIAGCVVFVGLMALYGSAASSLSRKIAMAPRTQNRMLTPAAHRTPPDTPTPSTATALDSRPASPVPSDGTESPIDREWAVINDPSWLKTKAGQIWKKHQDWRPGVCETLAAGSVQIGMTADQVRVGWGPPERVNGSLHGISRHEQWVWGSNQHAYFEDGILKSVQRSH
jgi:hypothetical protein